MVPELLVPVGNESHLKAAVANGADAVYLGLQAFNARIGAKNFSYDQFKEALDYCHVRNVKVYLVLNTLLNDIEIPAAIDMAKTAYQLGVDAVIVQDLGLIASIRELLPDLPIHASTQTTILNTNSALFFQNELELPRVILAREMSLKEIESMHAKTKIELESFVHGAMCVSYSGQCLASALSFKRSGNRGRCAQNCRMEYQLEKDGQSVQKPSYFLSAKDLEALDFLPSIAKAGIVSFKIEGRKKSTEYVAIATAVYRKTIDHFFRHGPPVTEDDKKLLHTAFNRNLSKGHFYGKDNTAIFDEYPGSMGFRVGKVVKFENGLSTILVEEDFRQWDVLSVKHGEERVDFPIKEIQYQNHPVLTAKAGHHVQIAIPLREGLELFRTQDRDLTRLMEDSLKTDPKIEVQFKVTLSKDVFSLEVLKGKNHFKAISAVKPVLAEKPLNPSVLESKLLELGALCVTCSQVDRREVDTRYFVPLSAIKQLKRDAVEGFLQTLSASHYRELDEGAFAKKKESFFSGTYAPVRKRTTGFTVKVGNWAQLEQTIQQSQPQHLMIDADWPLESIQKAHTLCREKGLGLVVSLPAILKDIEQEAILKKLSPDWTIQVNDWGSLYALSKKKYHLWAGPGLNAFNSTAIEFLSRYCEVIHPSLELTLKQLERLREHTNAKLEVTVFELGRVMTCEANPLSGKPAGHYFITDKNEWRYLVESDARDRLHLYNPLPLNLIAEVTSFYPIAESVQVDISKQDEKTGLMVLEAIKDALTGKRVELSIPFTRGQFEKAV